MPWQEPLDDAAATLCRGPDSRGALRQLADVDNELLSSCATGQQRFQRAHLFTLLEVVALARDFMLRLLLRQI